MHTPHTGIDEYGCWRIDGEEKGTRTSGRKGVLHEIFVVACGVAWRLYYPRHATVSFHPAKHTNASADISSAIPDRF